MEKGNENKAQLLTSGKKCVKGFEPETCSLFRGEKGRGWREVSKCERWKRKNGPTWIHSPWGIRNTSRRWETGRMFSWCVLVACSCVRALTHKPKRGKQASRIDSLWATFAP